MATQILVNIGKGNGLLPDGTKQLPEPMLTYRKYEPVRLHQGYPSHQSASTKNQLQFA